jgi:hypothetical protein
MTIKTGLRVVAFRIPNSDYMSILGRDTPFGYTRNIVFRRAGPSAPTYAGQRRVKVAVLNEEDAVRSSLNPGVSLRRSVNGARDVMAVNVRR